MLHYIGYYNDYGYTVCTIWRGSLVVICRTGNSRLEPEVYLDVDDPAALSLDEIKSDCERATKEAAEENGGQYAGVEQNEYADDIELMSDKEF